MLKILARTIVSFGINPILFINSLRGIPSFIRDYIKLRKVLHLHPDFNKISISPCLGDRYQEGGDMNSVYFQQDLYVAQHVFRQNPLNHLDIGSRTDGFIAHIATFRDIDVADIRAISSSEPNIHFQQADMMEADGKLYNKYDSISSLHAIEHFGLGRYGDPIDLDGHIKTINNIHNMLQDGGLFYFSTPIGQQRIEFNAHRVFNVSYLLKIFDGKFLLESFSYIDDEKKLHRNQTLDQDQVSNNYGCHYGCGIFILKKIKSVVVS